MLVSRIDNDPLLTGTHTGSTGTTLQDLTVDFRISGPSVGVAIHNDTQVTDGNITEVAEHTIVSDVSFDNGDSYSIYVTSAKDSIIATMGTDKSRGWECQREDLDSSGWFPEDHDVDKDPDGNLLPRRERPMKG